MGKATFQRREGGKSIPWGAKAYCHTVAQASGIKFNLGGQQLSGNMPSSLPGNSSIHNYYSLHCYTGSHMSSIYITH